MNIMMDSNFFAADPWQTQTYAPAYGAYHENQRRQHGGPVLVQCAFGLRLAGRSTGKPFVDRLWSAQIPTGTYRYYDGTLYMLSLLHVSGTFKLYY